jgi:hypothetical protein
MGKFEYTAPPPNAQDLLIQHELTLRDWFAGQALAGMHARDSYDDGTASPKQRARLAYIDADAMIEARKVQP